ncbi:MULTISPECIES: hypothetical protein [unclassified Lysinibacillus]|uniref:hypothetical protein n=1 Tax=unclassified Lysinibacillus TaxID=2636778 RepID=UPI00382A834C
MKERLLLQTPRNAKFLRLKKNTQGEASLLRNQQVQHDSPHISTTLSQEQIVKMMQIVEEIRLYGYK